MKSLALDRSCFYSGAMVITLATGCGGPPPTTAPRAVALPQNWRSRGPAVRHVTGTLSTVYAFQGGSDGQNPYAPLLFFKGKLYGTTVHGGTQNGGTVFVVTTSGRESVMHNFGTGRYDGIEPSAGLIAVNGILYGTTAAGGSYHNLGTVFSITTAGKERVIHSFGGLRDGSRPAAALSLFNGSLFGTTSSGGKFDHGTLFKITTSGREHVLYSFGAFENDGRAPTATLLVIGNAIYGETNYGGSGLDCNASEGCGTLFSSDQSGKVVIIYNFQGNFTDGQYPSHGLTLWNGLLYGTTIEGGENNSGTAFSATASGGETVLHSFGKFPDDGYPYSSLVTLGKALYGTVAGAGTNEHGTIFELGLSGQEQIVYSFQGGADGSQPYAGLTKVGRALYGTTSAGGAGYGTVFRVHP